MSSLRLKLIESKAHVEDGKDLLYWVRLNASCDRILIFAKEQADASSPWSLKDTVKFPIPTKHTSSNVQQTCTVKGINVDVLNSIIPKEFY